MPQTPVILYRRGNASGPRIDNVRNPNPPDPLHPPDLAIISQGGVLSVIARSGGVSCFDTSPCPGNGTEWYLPKDTGYPAGLYLRGDPNEPGHYTWEPDTDMTLDAYKALLRQVGLQFLRK